MKLDFLGDLRRTHHCGELRASDAGKTITLMGWVNRRRDLGSLVFIDLRDRTGMTQVVFDTESNAEIHEKAGELRSEWVIAVTGTVKLRDEKTKNKNIPTGDVEIVATELRLLNDSKLPPFLPDENGPEVNEETRLKYRYIDLRRPEMQANLELRHRVAIAIRKNLNDQGFFEVETPYLTRSTPEGARDYLVPSRVHPGEFYALPQSPQLFKQILMISGLDKYFQIARCFRDEDLRADRQPEFTQIDLEMSFPVEDTVFAAVEGFLGAAWETAGFEYKAPFVRMSYDDAIKNYGIDKPDMRLPAMTDVKAAFSAEIMGALGIEAGLPVVAVRIPKVGELSRKERDEHKNLMNARQALNIKVFDDFKRLEKSWPEMVAKIKELTQAEEGDLLAVVAGHQKVEGAAGPKLRRMIFDVYTGAGQFRLALAQKYSARHKAFEGKTWKFLWVTDFPMFEWDENATRWNAAHHPFTSPHESDIHKLSGGLAAARDVNSELGSMRSRAYDVVLNGMELGSGSIRIHQQSVQAQIFEALGFDADEQKKRFGFFLEALQYGTPPHGGIALGLDRIVMLLAGAPSLREVIPFPKTATATDLMCEAPTPVSDAQLKELGLLTKK